MKKVINWSLHGMMLISKEEMYKILFHKGRMLLLDQAIIEGNIAIGKFVVPEGNYDDHSPLPNVPVMRGVEIIEAAFQLLAIMVARSSVFETIYVGKTGIARDIGKTTFYGFAKPGDELELKTKTEVMVEESMGILKIESGVITAYVKGKKKCVISSLTIMTFDPSKIKKQ